MEVCWIKSNFAVNWKVVHFSITKWYTFGLPYTQNFEEKLYMNVGLDDKFGFDAENDWDIVRQVLIEYPENI